MVVITKSFYNMNRGFMKTSLTIPERKARIVLVFVLTLVVVLSGFLFLQNGPSRLAAATVVKGGDQTVETWDSLTVAQSITGEAQASENTRVLGSGEASFYGHEFAGRSTANGETFDPTAMTAAHRTLPFGSKVRVTNSHNGRSVVVRINDRGPFVEDRLIDVSSGAAKHLGMIQSGTARVMLELL